MIASCRAFTTGADDARDPSLKPTNGDDDDASTPGDGGSVSLADAQHDEEPGVNDSGAGHGPICNGELNCQRYVFVSSDVFTGEDMGGATSADARCDQVGRGYKAAPVFKQRHWQAWISDDNTNTVASARLAHGEKPYRMIDGTLVANSWVQLTSGSILATIVLDEAGNALSSDETVWTGTNAFGQRASATCTGWTLAGGSNTGTFGTVGKTDTTWTSTGNDGCSNPKHLYCIEK